MNAFDKLLKTKAGIEKKFQTLGANAADAYRTAWDKSQNTPRKKKLRKDIEGGWNP